MIADIFALIVVPWAAAAVAFVLRRFHTLTAFIAVGVAAALGTSVLTRSTWLATPGETAQVLGRQLVFSGADRTALATVFLVAAGLFLIGWRARPGLSFFALGLALLGLLSAALVIRPFLYSSLLLTIAAVLAAILVQGGTPGRAHGALRYLVMMTLALPAFLIANWLLDLYTLNPSDVGLASSITIALLAGFALLLSVVPFHIWIGPVTHESPPVTTVFVLTVFNSAVWLLLLHILQEYPWLSARQDVFQILQLLGLLTAVAGGVLAFSSYDFTHVMAYGVLADYGCALVALGTRTSAGLAAVLLATLARPASLAILALGITLARERAESSEFEKLGGLAWSRPWTAAALIVGGFSLAGVPPLAGFLGRWAEARLLASTQPTYALAVLGVTLGVAAGALRGMDFLLKTPVVATPESLPESAQPEEREPRLMIALIIAALVTGLTLSLFPGAVESALRTVVSFYTFLSTP